MVLLELSEQRYLANRPLPVSPTGLYDEQAQAFTERDGLDDNHSILNNLVNRAKGDVKRGLPLPADPATLDAFADKIINKDAIDDRKGLFTAGLSALSRLPPGSDLGKKLNDDAITLLYTTLPHPPQNFVGESRFRTADGSGNNPHIPNLGKAGTHYAKSVQSKHPFPAHTLPDPALVFDTLLRADKQTPHPGGNSSLTFAWASLVTHSLFRTNKDFTINDTSSYLDLSPLYGSNQVEQDSIRNKDGRGMLWPDVFSEARMQSLPPATAALLVIFSRNHNYIANNILNINEKKRWSNPPPTDSTKLATQDEEIFQTARLINCGHFMSIIFGDYVSGFLGMPRDGNTWSMNPFDPIKAPDGEHIGRGEGNHCSVEFNVLYRWHATVSAADEKWTETTFNRLFDNKPHDQLTLGDVFGALEKARGQIDPDPRKRTFAGLVRGPGGRFNDADIAGILHSAIENVAGAYGARRIPPVLRIVEILGMEQARKWSCCSMNEFRKFLGLKKFDTFEDWNPDPEIAGAARKLYGHIDNLELYPGLQAEAVMPLGPGQGLCAGYTTTRAILSDAIALVRGDRFYTTDFTPENLTSWGFQDCARDPNNGAFGAHLPKLLLRNLPFHMPWNSTYSLFPFFTPQAMKENLQRLRDTGKINNYDQYDFGKPGVVSIPRPINTLTGIRNVFNDSERFPTTYGNDMRFLTQGYGFFLVFEDALRHDKDKAMVLHALFPTKESMAKYTAFYRSKALALIQEKSFTYHNKPGKYLDIVRQVINLVSVHWAAELLCGIPLKTKANPSGLFTEQEVYDMFAILFTCVFKNTVPEESWSLRLQAAQAGKIVTDFIEKALAEVSPASSGGLSGILGSISSAIWPTTPRPAHEFLSKLTETGRPIKELSANVLGLAVGSSVNYAQAIAQVVDFYLEDKNVKEREHLIQLCQKDDAASNELIKGYIREAQRLEPQFAGLLRDVASDATIDLGAGEKLSVKKGDRIFASYRNAHLNPVDFPDPQKIDPTRPRTNYAVQGTGFHGCPGVNFTEQTAPEIIKAIFRLKNIRRVPGDAGKLAGFTKNVLGTNNRVFINQVGQLSSWPGSLFVVYDE